MKALSLTQPWATLVAIGAKRIETRSWSTTYRGELAIHAATGFPSVCRRLCDQQPFNRALSHDGWIVLPRGKVVAVATILEILLTGDFLNYRYVERGIRLAGGRSWTITPTEIAFGDYTAGRFAWLLDDVRQLREPIRCKGALGLWAVPSDVEAQIRAQLQVVA